MNKKALRVLEFNKIIDLLKDKASSSLGLKYIEKLTPSSNFEDVKYMLEETSEAQSILIKTGSVGLQGIHDIEDKVKRANIGASLDQGSLIMIADTLRAARTLKNKLSSSGEEDFNYPIKRANIGASLDQGSLIMIADTLRAARTLKNKLSSSGEEDFNYPIVQALSNSLYAYRDIEDAIYNAIISEVEISDNASSTLRDIRRRIVQKNQSIRSKLNAIISSTTYQKYLQDAIISVRGDRFVIPVKAEYRSQISGIVHDQSSSGATLFIEPMSIVDMNNELRQLRLKEKEEIERILQELSSMVGEVSEELISNQEILGRLDFAFAKGKLSIQMRGVEPKLNEDKYINIKNGRHPLLDKDNVVPNSIYLGRDFHTLLITGPNTGGKTVTIKTVGLFALMNQSGLHIPADYGTSMCVYDNVFADIGDEQSIEQSLSTFSSHMTNIVSILKDVTEDSLVIFDELGAGTDPIEGASLAIAILEDVHMAGAKCIATTHYTELKNYALTTNGVENAAVEFDLETLSPTYRLLLGVPGKSNAFEISTKLGLSSQVISRAKEFIDSDNIAIEDVLQNVEKSRLKTEEELRRAEKMREEVENIRNEYNIKMEKMQTSRDKMLENARSEAFSIIRQAKDSTDNMIKELKEIEKQRASKDKDRRIEKIRKEISESMGKLQPSVESMVVPKYASKEIKNLKAGEDVDIITLRQEGTVISADDKKKEALVQVGIMKMNLPYKSLKRIEKKEESNVTRTTRKIIRSKSGNVKREVDLRGMNLEEAIMKVEKYLDDACMAGHDEVTIIHGIGTGVLKKGISEWLKTNPHVKSMREGKYGEGGIGVTIVTVK